MLGTLLLCVLTLPANVLTVDDNGPADFTTIGDAVAAAQPGDVVQVASGIYGGFLLNKDLTLIGQVAGEGPRVLGVTKIDGAPRFVLAGFQCARLSIANVAGPSVVDSCSAGVWTDVGTDVAASIQDCDNLLIARSSFAGWGAHSGTGVRVTASQVSLMSCSVHGGYGYGDISGQVFPGGTGLVVQADSVVTLAGSYATGGLGGEGGPIFGFEFAQGGTGLEVVHSTVVVRGQPNDGALEGGGSGGGSGYHGNDLVMFGSARVLISGVPQPGKISKDAGSLLQQPPFAEPYLEILDVPVPAGELTVELKAPPGVSALLLASLQPGVMSLPKLEAPLWFEAGSLPVMSLVTGGGGWGFVFELPHDPQLVGQCIILQAVFPTLASTLTPGTHVITNPAAIVVRS